MNHYKVLDYLPVAWQQLGEAESNFEFVSLGLGDTHPLIIPLCSASLSSSGALVRRKPISTLLFEEAVRHRKLYKASNDPDIFCGYKFFPAGSNTFVLQLQFRQYASL